MNSLFNKFLAVHGIEHLVLDRNLKILQFSPGVERFADAPHQVCVGDEVSVAFPELIGVEALLMEVLEGREACFKLQSLGRFGEPNSPVYFDIYIIEKNDADIGDKCLIVFFEEVTERMVLEQKLVQATNETNLLLAELSTSKAYIEEIITSIAEALIVTNQAGTIKTINHSTVELFEYSEAELLNQNISRLTSAAEELRQEASLRESKSPENSVPHAEAVCKTKTDRKVYVAFSCAAVQTEVENVLDFVYIGRDITDRVRQQQRQQIQSATTAILSESTSFKEAAPRLLPALCDRLKCDVGELWMVKAQEQRSPTPSVGEGSVSVWGFADSAFHLHCMELWHSEAIANPRFIRATTQRSFSRGEGLAGEVWADRGPKWIPEMADEESFARREVAMAAGLQGAIAVPILGDRDDLSVEAENELTTEVLGAIVFFSGDRLPLDEDLLQTLAEIGSQIGQFIKRKQAEAALQESEERYRDLFENASDLIQSVAADGRFIYVNRAWRETLGYTQKEVFRLKLVDIIHPDCKNECLKLFRRIMSGEDIEQLTTQFITKEGEKIWVEGSIHCKIVEDKPIATRAILRDITERIQAEATLRQQQARTESLLLNILPETIAERLKKTPGSIAENFPDVSVLFADIVGFTQIASYLSPIELVDLLNQIFSAFDRLTEQHELEKIKTIGDAYMVVSGLPKRRPDHADAIAEMALEMQTALAQFNAANHKNFSIRIGIHSGSVVAGVIGIKKFIYDLWGDTVNVASRMESHGIAGQIQVSDATYQLLKDRYKFEKRGSILIKGKGQMNTYFLVGRTEETKIQQLSSPDKEAMKSVREATQSMVEMINEKLRDL
ncbi:adenylate/guanylate cyclase domain-containing protein [Phormidium sp. CCY1219]|uniref:adenylate/guanylate cyclase domain-containing protein n=1 Tax=Phormidium sp. CCY1219 TaxID=2886104 RepID=UPI002D1F045E|nr:adenylate/guanylate cyclase domain-containing protein [Phormidium sp. CCY1219]MEB3828147.1 PAS domain S-box protein [Phormidium sp. CCY1219]